ncbi:dihydroorotase [Flavobacterium psychrophilum]|uniref:dihydroorotase n=1 Tax=Flavobacterium psychrophilum TaxID=96345 RepID=UPI00106957BF|nr:dihydroorotase [Flavobacterium psychrophilum]MBF2091182.1 dihydroorotase [Flavobacterium psychrophilum]MEB3384955.1 dihydroorotase [Flavobacterium psychrophilum]MEB3389867.1 dihydroorotase [Flavobacterium psychrophilum]MEB3404000.1 dihydroorotase [Flavobacterium psychrophilum]
MNLILKAARIIDTKNALHNQVVDIKISNGIIRKIASNIEKTEGFEEIKLDNLHVSQGWFDTSVCLGEPGFEDRETIANGLQVAAKSGFTAIALQPNSFPILDNQSQINFVKQKANGFATELFPIGALTQKSEGNDLAELFDMKNAGAIAFTDYNKSLDNANLLKISLQYTQDFDGLVIAFVQDNTIKGKGMVHEGILSTMLGLKGIPSLAEELIVARNLFILEYTGGKLHIPTISSAKSVALIKEAKAKGLQVTCSVAAHNLILTDAVIEGFDTRYKVLPPLRTEEDKKALIEGILDHTIDCITSDHNPIDIENKKMEFDKAKYGTIGLESAFGALQTILPTEIIIRKLSAGRSLFGQETFSISEGQKANITLFNPEGESIFTEKNILSKSKNSAFLNTLLKGKVYGIYNQEKLVLA